jgi:hypothetical protein
MQNVPVLWSKVWEAVFGAMDVGEADDGSNPD